MNGVPKKSKKIADVQIFSEYMAPQHGIFFGKKYFVSVGLGLLFCSLCMFLLRGNEAFHPL